MLDVAEQTLKAIFGTDACSKFSTRSNLLGGTLSPAQHLLVMPDVTPASPAGSSLGDAAVLLAGPWLVSSRVGAGYFFLIEDASRRCVFAGTYSTSEARVTLQVDT